MPALLPTSIEVMPELEARIARRHVLKHPFYQAWNAGELTREALQDYAAQYYHHVAAFPTYLSSVHSRTEDMVARRILLENLMDEEAGEPNHPELWMNFAEGLGVSRETVLDVEIQPETREAIRSFRTACSNGHFTAGVAALYAYESQIPEVAETKMTGLKAHYGLSDEKTLKYFAVHKDADEIHRAQEKSLLEEHIVTESQKSDALAAADSALNAVWNILSGVCDRHGVVGHC